MAKQRVGELEFEYEIIGEGRPLLLIMGIGAQMIVWPDEFCERLAERGYQVIRFDNRDVGLSSHLHHLRVPNVAKLLPKAIAGLKVEADYTLLDMADDTAGLLSALGLENAHVVGISMGGMIAQSLTILHPTRVKSLTSIMSNTGHWTSRLVHPKALKALMGKPPKSPEDAAANMLAFYKAVGSTGFPQDEELIRNNAIRSYHRASYPQGFARHFAAIMASPDRTGALAFVRAPTAVVHGSVDPLVMPHGGRKTAAAIPGARYHEIAGMGHDLPRGAWERILDCICSNAERAEA